MPEPAKKVVLIGVPTDIGAGHRGASMGPEALRVAGLAEALRERGLDVVDKGNLSGPINPWLPPVDGYRHLEEVVAWNREVMNAIGASLEAGELPILLGGDHCLGVGSITAVARWCEKTGKTLRIPSTVAMRCSMACLVVMAAMLSSIGSCAGAIASSYARRMSADSWNSPASTRACAWDFPLVLAASFSAAFTAWASSLIPALGSPDCARAW